MIFSARPSAPTLPGDSPVALLRRACGLKAAIALASFLALGFPTLSFSAGNILEVDGTNGADDGQTPFATIAAALAVASSGDTIRVRAGHYAESLHVAKSLTLEGPMAESAQGETTPPPATIAGTVILAGDQIVLRGFTFAGEAGNALHADTESVRDILLENNRFVAAPNALALRAHFEATGADGGGADWTLRGNSFEYSGNSEVHLASFRNISSLVLENNSFRFTGQPASGSGALVIDGGQDVLLRGNQIFAAGNGLPVASVPSPGGLFGLQVGMTDRAATHFRLEDNQMEGTDAGVVVLDGALDDLILIRNSVRAGEVALWTRAPSEEEQIAGPQSLQLTENTLASAEDSGWSVFRGAGQAEDSFRAEENTFSIGRFTNAASGQPVSAERNFWGTAEWSGISAIINGAGSAEVAHNPWYADAARTRLVHAFSGESGIAGGEDFSAGDVVVLPDATLSVEGTLRVSGSLNLTEGAVLDVVSGSLHLGDGSSLSGSFTFFNSFGSVFFNDDVTLSGSASGLILAADVHIAPGATISISGKLVIDGSVVDSTGTYFFSLSETADFTMARTVFSNGVIFSASGNLHIYDNRFVNGFIVLDSTAEGARIYHNIVPDPASWIFGSGLATATTTVDGWGNVSDPADTQNNLLLDLDITGLPFRTKDAEGHIYIQPDDIFGATIALSALQEKIAGLEMLLGYSTDYLAALSLAYAADWDRPIVLSVDDAATIGKIDAAIGLSFSFADPSGKDADGPVAEVILQAGSFVEGTTLFFQRVKLETDSFGGETRLTTGGTSPAYLTPFTGNTGTILIDGTPPEIADATTHSSVLQDGEDMTLAGQVTLIGDLLISAAAFDAFAGLQDATALVTLSGPATYTIPHTDLTFVDIGGDTYSVYGFVFTVDGSTESGLYDVIFSVRDLSGNLASETLGTIEINPNRVFATVQLQGLVSTSVTREVVFTFTDENGIVLESRAETLEFLGGTASVLFEQVPPTTARVSAKTAWNLRRRLDIVFVDGDATANFTGAAQLLGGDLNGSNTVGTFDFGILSFYFNQVGGAALQADITGSNTVGTLDFGILSANFNTVGDPL